MVKSALFFILSAMTPLLSYAHGEDVSGPHGGYIQMPAGFHTEVVPKGTSAFQVFLLDMAFKNPTIKESKVDARIENGTKVSKLKCSAKKDHFFCDGSHLTDSGVLIISATREGAKASMDAKYNLPLKSRK